MRLEMKLGIALEGIRSAVELARLAERIETLGFDSLWTPDHVAYSQPICDPFQVLAIAASAPAFTCCRSAIRRTSPRWPHRSTGSAADG